MTSDDIEALRLKLLSNGYAITRNRDKKTYQVGWPTTVVDENEVRRWSRRFSRDTATGIRVEGELAVIDIDVDDKAIVDRIADMILDTVPELEREDVPLLVRHGKGAKEAWFVRTDELFSRIHSRAWLPPGASEDDGAHRVEVFGGAVARQFGAMGWHTAPSAESPGLLYRWVGRSPADTRQSELPVLTKAQFFAIVDGAEAILAATGWSPVMKSSKGENDAERVYDLTDEMQFDLDTGERVSLQRLRELAAAAGMDTLRCSASWLEGPSAKRTDRCIVGRTHAGHVTVWESASGVTHVEAGAKARDFGPEIDRIAEKLKELAERHRHRIDRGDGASVAATKLLGSYAFCPNQALGVVPLYATSMDDSISLQSFRTMMLPHCDREVGPRGGTVVINPVDLWAASDRRVTVRGLRMRPDMPRPVYEDADGCWVNIYTPPEHAADGGSPEAGKALIAHLLPDDAERHWFTQWLAHKVRRPWIPGPAVIMVARQFGTGRGTLGVLMGRLLGPQYVATLQFHMFAGRSYQSQYDDWGADTLMAVITEASEGGASPFAVKHDTYTHLKSLVEPKAIMRRYVSKSKHFKAMSFTSYFIATNEVDALPIPANDRRFAVLSNGDPGDAAFWTEINAALDDDANVAAFHDYLVGYDLAGYSPYQAPPRTDAQQDMVDLGRSDIDRGLEIAFAMLASPLYTPEQIVENMRAAEIEYDLSYPREQWRTIAKREAKKRGYRVGVRDGINWHPLVNGRRVSVYATTKAAANAWKESDRMREEMLKNEKKSTVETAGTRIADAVAASRTQRR